LGDDTVSPRQRLACYDHRHLHYKHLERMRSLRRVGTGARIKQRRLPDIFLSRLKVGQGVEVPKARRGEGSSEERLTDYFSGAPGRHRSKQENLTSARAHPQPLKFSQQQRNSREGSTAGVRDRRLPPRGRQTTGTVSSKLKTHNREIARVGVGLAPSAECVTRIEKERERGRSTTKKR